MRQRAAQAPGCGALQRYLLSHQKVRPACPSLWNARASRPTAVPTAFHRLSLKEQLDDRGSGNDVANGVEPPKVTPGEYATPCSASDHHLTGGHCAREERRRARQLRLSSGLLSHSHALFPAAECRAQDGVLPPFPSSLTFSQPLAAPFASPAAGLAAARLTSSCAWLLAWQSSGRHVPRLGSTW